MKIDQDLLAVCCTILFMWLGLMTTIYQVKLSFHETVKDTNYYQMDLCRLESDTMVTLECYKVLK